MFIELSDEVAARLLKYREWRSKVPTFLGNPPYTDSELISDLLAEQGW